MKKIIAIMWVITLISFSWAPVAFANTQGGFNSQNNGSSSKKNEANKVKNSNQAARIVKNQVGGKILKVKDNGRSGYKVKVIKDNGHIINVTVDAKSGRVKGK
jgi:uncharacterized membrane protein YkoI